MRKKPSKIILPLSKQRRVVERALKVLDWYVRNPDIERVYIGGSAIRNKLGVYERPDKYGRRGSDIDTIIVTSNAYTNLKGNGKAQRELRLKYEPKHHGQLYHLCDSRGRPIIFDGRHHLDAIVLNESQHKRTLKKPIEKHRGPGTPWPIFIKKFRRLK